MVAFIAGTTAELIKVSPVMRELRHRGHEPILWWTAMHGAVPTALLEQQQLADVTVRNLHAPDRVDPLTRPLSAARWMADAALARPTGSVARCTGISRLDPTDAGCSSSTGTPSAPLSGPSSAAG